MFIRTDFPVFAASGVASASSASLIGEDGELLDGELINDVNFDELAAAQKKTNAELEQIKKDLATLQSTVRANAQGNVSTSVAATFDRVVMGLSPKYHYVLYRESDYGYRLYYGEDISLSGDTFTGSGESVYYYTGNYNTNSYMSFGGRDDFTIDSGTYLTYSDLGQYPRLGVDTDESKAFYLGFFTFGLSWLLFGFLRFCIYGNWK